MRTTRDILRERRDAGSVSQSDEYIENRTIMRTNANRARFDDDGGIEKVNSPTTEEKRKITRFCIEYTSKRRARNRLSTLFGFDPQQPLSTLVR